VFATTLHKKVRLEYKSFSTAGPRAPCCLKPKFHYADCDLVLSPLHVRSAIASAGLYFTLNKPGNQALLKTKYCPRAIPAIPV